MQEPEQICQQYCGSYILNEVINMPFLFSSGLRLFRAKADTRLLLWSNFISFPLERLFISKSVALSRSNLPRIFIPLVKSLGEDEFVNNNVYTQTDMYLPTESFICNIQHIGILLIMIICNLPMAKIIINELQRN